MILALVVIGLFIVLGFFGFQSFRGASAPAPATGAQVILDELAQTGSVADLRIVDITSGTGAEAKIGDTVTVHYTGVLPDGTVFDSSVSHGSPFTFTIGVRQVIEGWERGIAGMKEGGVRLLAIPPSLGYGASSVGAIPPNATLLFQVELIQVNGASAE